MSSLQNYPDNSIPDTDSPNLDTIPQAVADVAYMDAEILLVARFHTLTLWRIFTSLLLCAFVLMCPFFGINPSSALYILLFSNLLPYLLEAPCTPYVKKTAPVLPYLRKRYHYSSLRSMTMNVTFIITGFLLMLWQFFNNIPAEPMAWLRNFPALLLAFGFFVRAIAPRLVAGHIRRKMGC